MRAKKWMVFLFAIIFLLAGCHKKEKAASVSKPEVPQSSSSADEEPDPNWPAEVRDIILTEKPETIISLSPALTEIVFL